MISPVVSCSNDLGLGTLAREGWTLVEEVPSWDEACEMSRVLGPAIAQYDGSLCYTVKAKVGYEKLPFTKSQQAIGPHTEAPDFQLPPPYIVLYGIHPDCHGEGETDVCDMRPWIQQLSASERRYLEENGLCFANNIHGRRDSTRNNFFSILETHRSEGGKGEPTLVFRFSHNLVLYGDINGVQTPADAAFQPTPDRRLVTILEGALAYFEKHRVGIAIPRRGLLVWNNHHCLHARRAYRDPRRELKRMWIGSPHRKTREQGSSPALVEISQEEHP